MPHPDQAKSASTLTHRPANQKVLIEFRHGLGDAVQLTEVLAHLKHYYPEWSIDVAAGRGKASALTGLCNAVHLVDDPALCHCNYNRVYNLSWDECPTAHHNWPSTKPTRCLLDIFGITPIKDLCHYTIKLDQATRDLAQNTLNEDFNARRIPSGRLNTVIIHYEGNTSQDRKDLPHDLMQEVCQVINAAGYVPVILDWDRRSPLIDNDRIHNPGPTHRIWKGHSIGDASTLAALIEASALMIGIDSGPLHVAGATSTPTIAVWTHHHPVHFFDTADNVTHLVPDNHHKTAAGRPAVEYFTANYNHQTYRNLYVELPALVQTMLTGEDFATLANKRFLNKLHSKAYNEQYYNEHKLAGLDYLNFGDWQRQYGRWLTDSLAWKGRRVLDVGCACGSIVRGFGDAGAIIQGVDVNEHMINLARKKWPDMLRIIHTCDATNLHLYGDAVFEGLHSAQVAEHFKPQLVPYILTELRRITATGSLFFCALDTTELFARQGRQMETEDPTHICVKPMAWWHEQLAATGWQLCTADHEPTLRKHPEDFLSRYDWDWFIARRLP